MQTDNPKPTNNSQKPTNIFLSFVVPVFNEADSLTQLHQELLVAAKSLQKPFEIIFIDDGSTDQTPSILAKLKPATVITLRKNFGQTAALDAGIKQASGRYVATLDGDLQNDPADIPKMLEKLEKDKLDFICGWRRHRQDSAWRRFVSWGARWLRSILVSDSINDSGCTLRVYKRECFENLTLRGEMHRFIPAILKWRGFLVGEVVVNHRPRLYGQTKYGVKRTVKGFLDMLSLWFFRKFSGRPLHFLGTLGLIFAVAGASLLGYLTVGRLWYGMSLAQSIWPLVSVFLILFGVQLFVSGLIMDLILTSNKTRHYYISEIKRSEA